MSHAISDLVHHRARSGDARFPIHEVFFDVPGGDIRYVAVDIGGWLEATEILVAASHLDAPQAGGRDWAVSLSEEDIADAPRWRDDTSDQPWHIENWPPLVVGPFGYTYSPLLIYEQLAAGHAAADTGHPATPGDSRVLQLERATRWLGKPVFGSDGELGKVDDLIFDTGAMKITHFVVGQGRLLSHHGHLVPFGRLRHMAEGDTHLVLDMTGAEVAKAPEPG
ncbi:hypothetical protein DDZ14_04605 [Maritimibacter sp. 55A14]|uniref:PRC-barrel domain-containing protein n=1 Tax=Maritimibacter sp. 55A14 TaxID=2174844 RepID=UPI000D60FF41|nr:PRC-barrel domain-containing protein [Maritimibacter sp. 55A14]PWE33483.1 hypothetical protein DDZ14_04605 [Maritimibacter sp. 55A14]